VGKAEARGESDHPRHAYLSWHEVEGLCKPYRSANALDVGFNEGQIYEIERA